MVIPPDTAQLRRSEATGNMLIITKVDYHHDYDYYVVYHQGGARGEGFQSWAEAEYLLLPSP